MRSTIAGILLFISMFVIASAFVVQEDLEYGDESLAARALDQEGKRQVDTTKEITCSYKCTQMEHYTFCAKRGLFGRCKRYQSHHRCVEQVRVCQRGEISAVDPEVAEFLDDGPQQWKRSESNDNVDSQQLLPMANKEQEAEALSELYLKSLMAFRKLYDEKVIKAEKYELSELDEGDAKQKEATVVIVLAGGRKLEVMDDFEYPEGITQNKFAVLISGEKLENWTLVEAKKIQFSTVLDFVRASDSSKSSMEAVEKMMALD